MKILHICLASSFTEGMSYQDNLLTEQNAKDGHDVTIISDCHKYTNGKMIYTPPEDIMLSNGVHLIRLEYKKIINDFISGKIRCVPQLYNIIVEENPDIILFHGVAGWELLTVAKYKKRHPHTRLFLDSHEDFNNSGTNLLSRIIQYKLFNKYLVKKVLPYVEKILCVAYECYDFLKQLYGVPEEKLEFYPLGGVIFDNQIREQKRDRIRKELAIEDDDILLIHSGKMDRLKRTESLLKAFTSLQNNRLKLILIGSMEEESKGDLEKIIISDNRIRFLGWRNANELMDFLCAGDLYVQPGSQSATMQNALCCGCAVAIYPHKSHKFLLKDNAFYISTAEDMIDIFNKILKDRNILKEMQKKDFSIAKEVLDYRNLAKRLYS